MAYVRNKKYFEIGLLFSQSLSFKAYKTCINSMLTHLVLKCYKNKNLQCSFKPAADATDKGKLYRSSSASVRKFCDGLEVK